MLPASALLWAWLAADRISMAGTWMERSQGERKPWSHLSPPLYCYFVHRCDTRLDKRLKEESCLESWLEDTQSTLVRKVGQLHGGRSMYLRLLISARQRGASWCLALLLVFPFYSFWEAAHEIHIQDLTGQLMGTMVIA